MRRLTGMGNQGMLFNSIARQCFCRLPYIRRFSIAAQTENAHLVNRYCNDAEIKLTFCNFKLRNLFTVWGRKSFRVGSVHTLCTQERFSCYKYRLSCLQLPDQRSPTTDIFLCGCMHRDVPWTSPWASPLIIINSYVIPNFTKILILQKSFKSYAFF